MATRSTSRHCDTIAIGRQVAVLLCMLRPPKSSLELVSHPHISSRWPRFWSRYCILVVMNLSSPITMPKSKARARVSNSLSASSTFTSDSFDSLPSTGSSASTVDHADDEGAVGLAGHDNGGNRKEMLQLINRLRDTGYRTFSLHLHVYLGLLMKCLPQRTNRH